MSLFQDFFNFIGFTFYYTNVYTNNNNCENSKKKPMIPIKTKKKKRSSEKSKSRSRHKRNNTFNSSDFSIIEDRVHNSSSVCDLFRNQAIKVSNRGRLQTTASNRLLPYSRRQKNAFQPLLIVQKKKPKKKVKVNKPKHPQTYQRIMLFPSSSQSEIVFSNDDTNRQSYVNPSVQKPSVTNQLMKKKTNKKIVNSQVDNWCNQQHQFVVTNKQTQKTIKNKSKNLQNNKSHSRESSLKNVHADYSNSQLRLMLSKQFQRKNEAAIKIQKVFRGYMTRKILDKYINHEEKILEAKLMEFSQKRALQGYSSYGREYAFNSNPKQYDQSRHYVKQRHKSRQQRYPDLKPHQRSVFEELSEVPNQTILKLPASNKSFIPENLQSQQRSFQVQDSLRTFNNDAQQLQEITKKEQMFKSNNSYQKSSVQKQQMRSYQLPLNISKTKNNTSQKQNQQPKLQKFDIYSYLQDKKNAQIDQSQSSQNQEEDEEEPIAYRRRQPIYSQQQISHYLESSETQQYGDEIYQPQIIYQTNEQYLQSRKSSLQTQKDIKNQLKDRVNNRRSSNEIYSHKNSQPYSINEIQESQSNKQQMDNLSNFYYQQKKFEGDDQRNERVQQNSKFTEEAIPTMNTKAYTDNSSINPNTYKQSHNEEIIEYSGLKRSGQKNSQSGKSSHSSLKSSKQKNKIKQLKQQQKQRWDHIIDLISKQVKMNEQKNSEMVNFMKSIIEMSKKNKQRLQGDFKDNQFDTLQYQTPTTTIDHQKIEQQYYSASNESDKLFFKNNRNNYKEKDIGKKITLDDSHSAKTPLSDKSFTEIQKQANDQCPQKKFKKKKNLEIQIIGDCNDEPLSLKQNKNINKEEQLSFKAQNQSKIIKKQHFPAKTGNILQKSNTVPASAQTPVHYQSNKFKTFLLENVQNDSVQQMLAIRQQLLIKKQAEILQKLNKQLSSGKLTQQQFIQKLGNLTTNFKEQKQSIDKARIDIEKGFKAAMSLVKQACDDAKRLGMKMSLSRSLGSLKVKNPLDYGVNNKMNLKKVIVDELQILTPAFEQKQTEMVEITQKKRIDKLELPLSKIEKPISEQQQNRISRGKVDHSAKIHEFSNDFFSEQQSSSSIQFTQQQLQRFRKIQPFDSQFIEMNKNITISEDFIKKHQEANQDEDIKETEVKHEGYKKQIFEVDLDSENSYQAQPSNPKIDAIVSQLLLLLILQISTQIVQKPIMLEKMISQSSLIRPMPITSEQQLAFINLIEKYFPEQNQILQKLNQKISPLPIELLKCMRIDFSEDDDDDNDIDNQYQEIGKYEFIIGQQICTKALIDFKEKIQAQSTTNSIFRIQDQNVQKTQLTQPITLQFLEKMSFDQKILKYIERRQNFIKQRKEHTKGLRWEILNIEVHCIFDAWNEQLIQLRTKKPGFSGIGLNELTLSLVDQNTQIKPQQTISILKQGKQKLQAILNDDSDLNTKLMKQNYEQMCYNDSTWVYYADQAMSYGLELDYLVEQEIFSEIAGQLLKLKQLQR